MAVIAEHTLSRLIAQTKGHIGGPAEAEYIQVLTFEFDGERLYAWATNRYTLGIARTKATAGAGERPWTALVDRRSLPDLAAAVRLLDKEPITVTLNGDNLLLSGSSGTHIAIPRVVATKPPMDWRKAVAPALERKAEATPMTLSPTFFAAWKSLPGPVSMWSTGAGKPALVVAADFLGLQMPVRSTTDGAAFRDEMATWRPKPTELAAA